MTPRRSAVLLGVFLLTRVVTGFLAVDPDVYRPSGRPVGNDVNLYASYAAELTAGALPYADVAIEYPPGALPVVLAPAAVAGAVGYRGGFVGLMLAVDALGLAALWGLGRRWGSHHGAWLWVLGLPLLGPIAYLRLDLVPAVLTIAAVAAAAACRWGLAGGWLGAGALVKLYPGLLVLPVLAGAGRRWPRVAVAAVVVGLAGMLTAVGVLEDLLRAVFGYHLERGIQVESTWASILLVRDLAGGPGAAIDFDFGAYQVAGPGAGGLKTVATAAAVAALATGTALAARVRRRVDAVVSDERREGERARALAAPLFTTMALLLATGSVFSPQYVLWALGLGAAALTVCGTPVAGAAWLLLPVAALTQVVYPVVYTAILEGEPPATAVLVVRNAVVVVLAVWATIATARRGGAPPDAEDVTPMA